MRASVALLVYLMTWLRPLLWLACCGLVLLAVALVAGFSGASRFAFGLSIYAYVAMLAIPYLLAWHPFRVMLSARRLALLPGFRLRLGSALLALTLLLALYMPVMASLFWPGATRPGFALAVFIAASLYSFLLQWAVASRYSVLVFSLGPLLVLFVGVRLWPVLMLALARPESRVALALAAGLGWALALRLLTSRRAFSPPCKVPMTARDYVWEGRGDWLGMALGNYRGPVNSAAGTLLLGTPDGFSGRFSYLLGFVFISPLVCMAALYVAGLAPAQTSPNELAGMFLTFSLTTSLCLPLGNGELAARNRLIWLRQSGDRTAHWQGLEHRLLNETQMLALIVVPLAGVVMFLFPASSFDPLTYCVAALACNVFGNYFSVVAKLYRWSLFVQGLSLLALGVTVTGGYNFGLLNLAGLVAVLLGLALYLRVLARRRFADVCWFQLRPACSSPPREQLS